ncbi:MAG: DNA/RNA non-specific endonuclease [Burkholderiaceae bacterium]
MLKHLLAIGIFLIGTTHVFAARTDFGDCTKQFANGVPPAMVATPAMRLRALCFADFAVMHSGTSRTPVYVAELLNKQRLLAAKDNDRTNRFFADARLPRAERAELDDYKGTGLDRGHMAPAGDMGTTESMAQSFSLANMVPQYPVNNRKTWSKIEKDTRKYVLRAAGDVFVITGPVFGASPPTIGMNKVWVPQYFFKLVYDPVANKAWVHWLDNTDEARVSRPISYAELAKRTGIEFLPGISL